MVGHHDVVKKGWVDDEGKCSLNTPVSRGRRKIILHAGDASGWVENELLLTAKDFKTSIADYHENMSAQLFELWFENNSLPKIATNSVIVMDTPSYHSRHKNTMPTTTRKTEMIDFLINKNIPIPEKQKKKKILLKIIKEQTFTNCYIIDNMAQEAGHKILRLPPYYCIFNPIELICSELQHNIIKKKCFASTKLQCR